MKHWIRIIGVFLLMFFAFSSNETLTYAAGEQLELHVHKNTLTGDEWVNTQYPIRVSIRSASSNQIGIGIRGPEYPAGNGQYLLDPNKGGLAVSGIETCQFSWIDSTGALVERESQLTRYSQLPANQFLLPPVRISEARILMDTVSLQYCGGGENEYQNFLTEISELPANPFRAYRETLSLPVAESLLGSTISVSIAADPANSTLSSDDVNPGNQKLEGYACALTNATGERQEGLCEVTLALEPTRAENGIFRADLVILQKQTETPATAAIDEPLLQGVNAEFSTPVTIVGNFMVRTTALLDWVLAIDETGFRNEKITTIYEKSLGIVNGFFILALLAIALMWNFSLLISRDRLKRMVLMFIIGILCVNFSLPVTRLLVDGTNILQRTLLIKELDQNERINPDGSIVTDGLNPTSVSSPVARISASDILSASDLDASGAFIGLQKTAYLDKNYPQELGTPLDAASFEQKSDRYIDRFTEQTWFNLILTFLGAFGQFLIAVILTFRYVILWFLLIFSPFLLVLALFQGTRFLFRYWLWLYGRWLLIGPILAMSLFIIVNIWSLSGVPLESSYAAPSSLLFPNTTNLYVAAPGITSGYLNTPREIMKYITALIMLYMAVILPFWLTRYIPGGTFSASTKSTNGKHFFTGFGKKISTSLKSESHRQETSHTPTDLKTLRAPEIIASREAKQSGLPGQSIPLSRENSTTSESSTLKTAKTADLIAELEQQTLTSNEIGTNSNSQQLRVDTRENPILSELQTRAASGDTAATKAIEKHTTSHQEKTNTILNTSTSSKKTLATENVSSESAHTVSTPPETPSHNKSQNTEVNNTTPAVLSHVPSEFSESNESANTPVVTSSQVSESAHQRVNAAEKNSDRMATTQPSDVSPEKRETNDSSFEEDIPAEQDFDAAEAARKKSRREAITDLSANPEDKK